MKGDRVRWLAANVGRADLPFSGKPRRIPEAGPCALQLSNVTLRAKVDNIFDETYSDRATYGQEFSTVVPLRSPGRSFGVSARIEF